MKNKVVTAVCIILVLLAIICFGYIFLNMNKGKNEKKEEQVEENGGDNQEIIEREERGQNIIVTSRIGVQLKELIKLSEIYSNTVINELDQNGVDNEAKILFALDKVFRKPEFVEYVEYSETYSSTAIAAENIKKIIDDTFVDSDLTLTSIDGVVNYDEASQFFIIPPIGLEGGTLEYTVEVPYKITEYEDRIELLAYRLYITKKVEMNEAVSISQDEIYYDKAKTNLALIINDGSLETQTDQIDYLKSKIDEQSIDVNNLQSVKYTFKNEDEKYKIVSFEKI